MRSCDGNEVASAEAERAGGGPGEEGERRRAGEGRRARLTGRVLGEEGEKRRAPQRRGSLRKERRHRHRSGTVIDRQERGTQGRGETSKAADSQQVDTKAIQAAEDHSPWRRQKRPASRGS